MKRWMWVLLGLGLVAGIVVVSVVVARRAREREAARARELAPERAARTQRANLAEFTRLLAETIAVGRQLADRGREARR